MSRQLTPCIVRLRVGTTNGDMTHLKSQRDEDQHLSWVQGENLQRVGMELINQSTQSIKSFFLFYLIKSLPLSNLIESIIESVRK